jgi:peptide/nickel transport system substrate-binding protein
MILPCKNLLEDFMKRIFALAFLLVLVLGAAILPLSAQEAPTGTWLGTWNYTLTPDHDLNGFSLTGLNTNLGNIFRGMVELTPAFYLYASDEWVPLLAESWGFAEDSSYYEIKLRQDALWSNGSAVNADDIVVTYTLGRVMGWSQFNYINEVEKVDDFTVRFHFTDQPALLLERLVLKEYIVARDSYSELAAEAQAVIDSGVATDSEEWTGMRTRIQEFDPAELIASGPYTYSLADVGDSFMTLSWQPNSIFSDTVNFGEVKIWRGETESTTPLVLSSEIAHATNVYPPATVQSFVDAGIQIVQIPRGYGPALLFNHALAPWDVTEIRQAFAYVIDREQNAFITNGIGATATEYMAGILDSFVPNLMTEEDIAALNRYELNLDEAASLMETAGYTRNADGKWADAEGNTVGGEFKFPSDFVDFSAAAQDAIAQLNDFGFDIVPLGIPSAEASAAIREGNFNLSIWSWGNGTVFADRHFTNPLIRWGSPGIGFDPAAYPYGDAAPIDLGAMVVASSAGLDRATQMEATGDLALLVNQTMPYIPLNVIISAEPWNSSLISGLPEAGDPILQNPTGSDHFVILYLLNGTLAPAN